MDHIDMPRRRARLPEGLGYDLGLMRAVFEFLKPLISITCRVASPMRHFQIL